MKRNLGVGEKLVKFIDPAGRALRSDSFSSLCYFVVH